MQHLRVSGPRPRPTHHNRHNRHNTSPRFHPQPPAHPSSLTTSSAAGAHVIKQRLAHSLAVNTQVVDGVLAVCPRLADEPPQLVTENLELLHSFSVTAQQVRRLVLATPQLLATPLQAWQQFLTAYGLHSAQIWRLLVNQPALLLHGSIFGAGRAIMFLQQLGWSDVEVSTLVIQHTQHAAILLMDTEHLHSVLGHLTHELGMSQQSAAAFVQSHPAVLYTPNYRQHVQQLLWRQRVQQLNVV